MEKSERFGLVLTPCEKEVAAKLADKEGGLSIAALVRRLIREAAHAAGLWPSIAEPGGSEEHKSDEK